MILDFIFPTFKLIRDIQTLQSTINTQSQTLEALMLNLETLRAEIAENNDAVASAVTLISTLVTELKAAAGNQAEIDAIVTALDAQTAVLAAAVAANTPADPEVLAEEPIVE
jgi:ABC-type transporter Mla subunit MlaD